LNFLPGGSTPPRRLSLPSPSSLASFDGEEPPHPNPYFGNILTLFGIPGSGERKVYKLSWSPADENWAGGGPEREMERRVWESMRGLEGGGQKLLGWEAGLRLDDETGENEGISDEFEELRNEEREITEEGEKWSTWKEKL
jgi:hypothetical protein